MDHGDEGGGRMKSEGPMADHADLVVHALGEPVADTLFEKSANAIEMVAQRACKLDERRKAATRSPTEPSKDRWFRGRNSPTKDLEKRFLQEISTAEWLRGPELGKRVMVLVGP
jgi:hypothetical protein